MKRLPGLRVRLFVVMGLVLLVTSVLVYLEVRSDHEQGMASSRDSAKYAAASTAQRVAAVLDSTRQVLETMAAAPSIRNREWTRAGNFARAVKERNPAILNIAVADISGKVLVSVIPVPEGVNLCDREYFRLATRDDTFTAGDYQVGRITRKQTLVCALPLHDETGRPWGIVLAALDVAEFGRALERQPLPENAAAMVFDDGGHVIASTSGAGRVGGTVPDWKIVQEAVRGARGPETIAGIDGVHRVYGFQPAFQQKGQRLFVAVGLDERTLFSSPTRMYLEKLAFASVAGLLVLGVAWLLTNVLVFRQIAALRDVARRLAHGDFDARANLPQTGDELGELAAECDAMASSLGRYVRRVERDERRYRELASLLPVGVFVIDEKRHVRFANVTGLSMLGVASLPEEGIPFFDHVREGDRDELAAYLDAVRRGETRPLLAIGITNGRETEVEFAGAAWDDDEPLVMAIAHDVTERKAVEQIKSDFLSMVSHELRTPLTTVMGYTQLLTLRRHQDEHDIEHIAGRISESAEHMNRMVEDLLAVLQAETRSFCGEKRSSDMRGIVEKCIADACVPPTHTVELKVPHGLRPVDCDPDAVGHAVANLLTNAVKFSPEGGRVTVRVSQKAGRTRIDVADQGIGVPESERERIFERFAQVDMSSTRSFGGFGVGLFIVRQVAEAHNGTAFVAEGSGGGSVFTLELGSAA